MRKIHPTAIAVHFLLIVVLAIQPWAVCMAKVDRASGCASTSSFTCQGCGCCEVQRAADRCCCCSGPIEVKTQEKAEASCCSRKHEAFTDSEPWDEYLDSAVATTIVPEDGGVRSICLCSPADHPLGDSSPRRPARDNRDRIALGSTDLDQGVWNRGRLLAATQYFADLPVPERFSQVVLCIWRL